MKKKRPSDYSNGSSSAALANMSAPAASSAATEPAANHAWSAAARVGAGTLTAFDYESGGLYIEQLSKSYGSELVLEGLSIFLAPGRTYCLMAPSGSGKTTLFRILMGLERADSGQIHGLSEKQLAAVFQENRLLEGYTALENIRFVTGRMYSNEELTHILRHLLPEESLTKPICEFSGGMKRRTAILRAILAPSDFIIMDEPFTGLDAETKQTAIDLIKEYTSGKLLLISTHHAEDAALLGGEIITLPGKDKK